MNNASMLNAKSGILASASYCSCWPAPRYQGPEKSKNHRHELGEILISLGRSTGTQRLGCVRTAAISTPFDHLLGAREQRCRHFEGPSTYAASIRRRVEPLRRRLAQLRGFAILRGEETRCYELRGAHPAAW